jgi:lactocepin
VERGEIPFVEKIKNAAANGAVGVIIYNNEDGDPVKMDLIGAALPALSIRRDDGLELVKAKEKEVSFSLDNQALRKNENAGKISAFSSWGATPSLTLKPEITAVGGGVLSTIRGGSYAGMSGTSMAAPQLTGVCTLLIEQLKKNEPQLLPNGYDAVIRAALMNTAVPITDETGAEVSPRAQGAGLIDAGAALSPELRLTYTPTGKPKAELYDLIGDAAYLDLTLENLTGVPLTVTLGASVLTDGYILLGEGEEARWHNTLTSAADNASRVMLDGVNINKNAGGCILHLFSQSSDDSLLLGQYLCVRHTGFHLRVDFAKKKCLCIQRRRGTKIHIRM